MMEDECLEVQLNELDMLMSMFNCDSELILDDPSVVADISTSLGEAQSMKEGHRCSEGQAGGRRQHGQVGFTMKLQTGNEHTIEMIFRLPLTYPKSAPDVSFRISVLSRHNHQLYNERLQSFIRELRPDEPVIYEIIQWIKETSDSFIEEYSNSCSVTTGKPSNMSSASMGKLDFSRLWIYSHHIYNKVKRKSILDLANDLGLTGFSVPGKPGIICVEGNRKNSEDFWQKIRSMQWKKISLIHREDLTADDLTKFEELRAFRDFEEKHFDPKPGRGREVHMDLGLLFQFLQEKGFSNIFQMYFGIKGRESEQDNN